jgi:hypothetical protein
MKKFSNGYRVDMQISSGAWIEYTSYRLPVSKSMAESLFEHLKRNKCGCRLIEVNKKQEKVVREWLPS